MASERWIVANRSHREPLSVFVCTDPSRERYDRHRGRHHPYPWELEVQSHLRALRTPVPTGETVLIGVQDDRIVSATHFGFEKQGDFYMIWATATALGFRGRGIGRRAVGMAIDALSFVERERKRSSAVLTHIDPRNKTSQRLFSAAGFERLDCYENYEAWIKDLP